MGSLHADFLKLAEQSGLTDLAKEVGFIDKNNEIEKLRHYEGPPSLLLALSIFLLFALPFHSRAIFCRLFSVRSVVLPPPCPRCSFSFLSLRSCPSHHPCFSRSSSALWSSSQAQQNPPRSVHAFPPFSSRSLATVLILTFRHHSWHEKKICTTPPLLIHFGMLTFSG